MGEASARICRRVSLGVAGILDARPAKPWDMLGTVLERTGRGNDGGLINASRSTAEPPLPCGHAVRASPIHSSRKPDVALHMS
jgi:hypothetical protein